MSRQARDLLPGGCRPSVGEGKLAVTVPGVESFGTDAEPMSLADKAYLAIQDKLIMLDIRPNEAIVESELAAELGAGRTPVREALKRLEVDHLVASYPRRGTFATACTSSRSARELPPRGRPRRCAPSSLNSPNAPTRSTSGASIGAS